MNDSFVITQAGAEHLPEIRAIFNHAIAHSTALYEYEPRSEETLRRWWEAKVQGRYPVLAALARDSGRLLGFASYGPFRMFPAYKYTAEHSVYVAEGDRRKGVGRALLRGIVKSAEEQGLHTLVGAIDAANEASIRLHVREGFVFAGLLPEVGFKFGGYLDLALYQRVLPGPAEPRDG